MRRIALGLAAALIIWAMLAPVLLMMRYAGARYGGTP